MTRFLIAPEETPDQTDRPSEKGVALLLVVILSVMLALTGLTMTFDSMSELTIAHDLEGRQKALTNADTGFNAAKGILRGKDLSLVLSNYYTGVNATADLNQPISINKYINYSIPTASVTLAYFDRNPLAPMEAMNVNFLNPPVPVGTRDVNGFLTPAAGVDIPFEPHAGADHTTGPFGNACHGAGDHSHCGRYWAKLTDNVDGDGIDEDLDGDLFDDDENGTDSDHDGIDDLNGDPMDSLEDTDGIVYLRVLGIQPLGAGRISTYGTTSKNAVAILEAKLERDMSFDLSAPFALYGTSVSPAQGGSFFNGGVATLDGYDHPGYTLADLVGGKALGKGHAETGVGGDMAGIDVMEDDPGANNAAALRDTIYAEIPAASYGDIRGDKTDYPGPCPAVPAACNVLWTPPPGVTQPSLRDATEIVRASSNPDSANIFDPAYTLGFMNRAAAVADIVVPDGGSPASPFGTDADPKIVYCPGDCDVAGGSQGVGLFIVRGRMDVNAGFHYRGLILAVGAGEVDMAGLNGSILGGVFAAKVAWNGSAWEYQDPAFTVSGNSNFFFQGSGIRLGYTILPFKVLSWREIVPELEP